MSTPQRSNNNRRRRRSQRGGRGGWNSTGPSRAQKQPITALSQWHRNEVESAGSSNTADSAEDEGPVCVVCANPIVIAALSPCNHIVCHTCAFRQLALYEKRQCLVCRTELDRVIFTETAQVPESEHYSDVPSESIVASDEEYSVDFTSFGAKNTVLGLLEFRCPEEQCKGVSFPSVKRLNEHVRQLHGKQYCTLCAKFKKAFVCELRLYAPRDLQVHNSKGCSDEEGFKGHPLCRFCSGKRFYSDDELYVHLRERHERCHVCDQIDASQPQYFRDYDHLFEHFRSAHMICTVQSCLDKKFVVFRDDLELQAHMLKEHGDIFGGADRLLLSSSSLSVGSGFGTHLSTLRDEHERPQSQSASDSREVKQMRLEERARHYLHYSQPEFVRFKRANQDYDQGILTGLELLAEYKRIFGAKKKPEDLEEPVDYSVLIYELSRLYPSSSPQRKELEDLKSPELEQKKLEEKFPELPGTNSSSSLVNNWGSRSSIPRGAPNAFPALPSAPPVRFSSNRMGRSASTPTWAPPLNASSVPGYTAPAKRTSSKSTRSAASSTQSLSSLVRSPAEPAPAPKINRSQVVRAGGSVTYRFTPRRVTPGAVDENKFPKLPEVKKKKKITRVNPVNNSMGQWGGGTSNASEGSSSSSSSDVFETGSLRQALGTTTRKGKKGKVVFHIGVGN